MSCLEGCVFWFVVPGLLCGFCLRSSGSGNLQGYATGGATGNGKVWAFNKNALMDGPDGWS